MGTGEQDPGLPGFGVHLGEHSSNPGVKRRKGKSAGCLGHGGNGGRAQLYRGYVCLVAEVRVLSGICEGKKGTISVCPKSVCEKRQPTALKRVRRWCCSVAEGRRTS